MYAFGSMIWPNETPPIGLHSAMFLPTLEHQCSPEQKTIWVPLARENKILGTYAQTEIGHGMLVSLLLISEILSKDLW